MFYEGFSVQVNEGEEDNGYVSLKNNQKYSIVLMDTNGARSDATIKIDGKEIGTFRVEPYSVVTIHRPLNDHGCFTFFRNGTKGFKQSGLGSVKKSKLGLVSVTFKQEIKKQYIPTPIVPIMPWPNPWVNPWPDRPLPPFKPTKKWVNDGYLPEQPKLRFCCSTVQDSSEVNMDSGGTGITGYSSQEFTTVDGLIYDESKTVKIHLRLVEKTNKNIRMRPLKSIKSTRIPEPV